MILNLTGQHIVTSGGVYPASGPAPTVRLLDTPPDYPTPAEILADLGIQAEGVVALTGTPIRIAPILDGIGDFPDIPADIAAVIVPLRVAEGMRRLGLTVRRGVAILSPTLQRWLTADDANRLAPNHAAAIRSLTGALTWADMLTLHEDLTGMHDAPGLHREAGDHPVDAASLAPAIWTPEKSQMEVLELCRGGV